MRKKLTEIHQKCRDQIDEISLIIKGENPANLSRAFERLSAFAQEAIQEIKIANGEVVIGEHQHNSPAG